jgi:hypothetical protein
LCHTFDGRLTLDKVDDQRTLSVEADQRYADETFRKMTDEGMFVPKIAIYETTKSKGDTEMHEEPNITNVILKDFDEINDSKEYVLNHKRSISPDQAKQKIKELQSLASHSITKSIPENNRKDQVKTSSGQNANTDLGILVKSKPRTQHGSRSKSLTGRIVPLRGNKNKEVTTGVTGDGRKFN